MERQPLQRRTRKRPTRRNSSYFNDPPSPSRFLLRHEVITARRVLHANVLLLTIHVAVDLRVSLHRSSGVSDLPWMKPNLSPNSDWCTDGLWQESKVIPYRKENPEALEAVEASFNHARRCRGARLHLGRPLVGGALLYCSSALLLLLGRRRSGCGQDGRGPDW